MAGVVQASMADILLACRAEIFAVMGDNLPIENIRIVGQRQRTMPRFTADRDVLLRPGPFISRSEAFDGAGRTATKFRRLLFMVPRNRYELDEAGDDRLLLTDETVGYLRFEETITAILSGFHPQDDAENLLTYEPIRIADGQDPITGRDTPWSGDGAVRFEVEYLFSFRQPEHGIPEDE